LHYQGLSAFIRGLAFLYQPFPAAIVYTDVMGSGAKFGSGLVLAAAMLIGTFQATASPHLHRFLAYYQAVQKTDAPLDFWERVAASFALTQVDKTRKPVALVSCSRL
jgi:hypothetical protein